MTELTMKAILYSFLISFVASCYGHTGDWPIREDISLYLVQPYENLIMGEGPHYYLGIKNGSKDDLLLNIGGDLDTGELWYASKQSLLFASRILTTSPWFIMLIR